MLPVGESAEETFKQEKKTCCCVSSLSLVHVEKSFVYVTCKGSAVARQVCSLMCGRGPRVKLKAFVAHWFDAELLLHLISFLLLYALF